MFIDLLKSQVITQSDTTTQNSGGFQFQQALPKRMFDFVEAELGQMVVLVE